MQMRKTGVRHIVMARKANWPSPGVYVWSSHRSYTHGSRAAVVVVARIDLQGHERVKNRKHELLILKAFLLSV